MADMMKFPETIEEFLNSYSFKDKEEVYTNGSILIPLFRVEQGLERYVRNLNDEINRQTAENERLKERISYLEESIDCSRKEYNRLLQKMQQVKSEAIKEFTERLKEIIYTHENRVDVDDVVLLTRIDNSIEDLVKEMTEEKR